MRDDDDGEMLDKQQFLAFLNEGADALDRYNRPHLRILRLARALARRGWDSICATLRRMSRR